MVRSSTSLGKVPGKLNSQYHSGSLIQCFLAQLVTGLVALVIALWLIFEPKAKTVQDAGKGDAIHFKSDAIAGLVETYFLDLN